MFDEKKKNGFLNSLKPKTAFWLGLLSSLAIIFVVGFFILLAMVVNSDDVTFSAGNKLANNNAPVPTNNQPAQAGEIQLVPVSSDDWIRGDVNAPISIVEFSDLECPFCKRFHPTLQQIVEEYDGQVNWVYRHFPLVSLHSKAPKEAEATECAGELGGNDGFWKYIDRLFAITPANNGLDLEQLPVIAEYVGLNRSKFEECLASGKYAAKVRDHTSQAQAAGGRGTPYSVIVAGSQKIPVSGAVSFAQLKSMIDQLLNQ